MSWSVQVTLNQILTALRTLQAGAVGTVKNPMIASLSAGGFNITSVGQFQERLCPLPMLLLRILRQI
jgi:hypothetical protein